MCSYNAAADVLSLMIDGALKAIPAVTQAATVIVRWFNGMVYKATVGQAGALLSAAFPPSARPTLKVDGFDMTYDFCLPYDWFDAWICAAPTVRWVGEPPPPPPPFPAQEVMRHSSATRTLGVSLTRMQCTDEPWQWVPAAPILLAVAVAVIAAVAMVTVANKRAATTHADGGQSHGRTRGEE